MFSKAGVKGDESSHEKQDKTNGVHHVKSVHHASSHSSDKAEPVKVYLRVRPEHITHNAAANDEHEDSGHVHSKSQVVIALDDKTVRLTPPDGLNANKRKSVEAVDDRLFSFDKVYNQDANQEEIYRDISSHVNATVRGYNTTVFAYGSTGSGKTFTMTGNSAAPGIIPRAISEIFSIIEATAAKEKDVFFYVRLSYVELYNNTFRNLLEQASKELAEKERESEAAAEEADAAGENAHPTNCMHPSAASMRSDKHKTLSPSLMHPNFHQKTTKIEVRESQTAGIFLAGAHLRIPVITAQEAFQLINKGNKTRATGSTQCNDFSSRSHAILTLHVESRVAAGTQLGAVLDSISMSSSASPEPLLREAPELRLGKMHLVDLAGSERLTMSGAEGETLLETQSINLSLTAIGDVLAALSRNASILSKAKPIGGQSAQLVPVPYRNSKLTHLLKDSLGGNSKTIMIATVRTRVDFYQQTVVSLMYASRAKKVRNRSLVNRDVIGDTGIHAVSTEIERLKTRLDARTHEFESLRMSQMKESKENATLKSKLQSLTAMNEAEKEQLENQMSTIITSQAGQLAHQREKITSLQGALQSELALSQTRIKEQEKEIHWLKTALDESAQTVKSSIPPEQLQGMQKIVDAWQGQAENTQRELDSAQVQIDTLRVSNNSLGTEIATLQISKQELVDQMVKQRSAIEKLTILANEAKADKAALAAAKYETERGHVKVAEAVTMAEQGQLLASQLRIRSDELASQLDAAQQEVAWQKEVSAEFATKANEKIKSYEARCAAHENEKTETRRSFSKTLSMLENKTSSTIENAVRKVQDTQAQLELECRRADTAQAELVALREHASQSSQLVHNDLQARDQTVVNLSEQLRLAHSQSNELAEHISDYREASKKKEDELAQAVAQLTRADAEMERILDEHNSIKKTNTKLVEEMSALHSQHKDTLASMKQEHSAHITALKQEHVRNEVEIRAHLQQTEAMIRDQVQAGAQRHTEEMVSLVESHRVAFMKLQAEAEETRADHEKTQEELRLAQHEQQKQAKSMEDLLEQRKEAMLAHIAEAEQARNVTLLEKEVLEKQLADSLDQLETARAALRDLELQCEESSVHLTEKMTLELQEVRSELQSAQQKAKESRVALEAMQVTHAEVLSQEQSRVAQLTQSMEAAKEKHAQQVLALTHELETSKKQAQDAQHALNATTAAHQQKLLEQARLADQAAQVAQVALDDALAAHAQELVQLQAHAEQATQQVLEKEQFIHAEQLQLMVQQKEEAVELVKTAQTALETATAAHAHELEQQKIDAAQVAQQSMQATEKSLQHEVQAIAALLNASTAHEAELVDEVQAITALLNASTTHEAELVAQVTAAQQEQKAFSARELELTKQIQSVNMKHKEAVEAAEAAHMQELNSLTSAADAYMKKLTLTETQLFGSAAVVEELELELSKLQSAIKSKDVHVMDLALQHQLENDKLNKQWQEQQKQELSQMQTQLSSALSDISTLKQQRAQLQSDLSAAHIATEAETVLRTSATHATEEAKKALNALKLQMDVDSRNHSASKDSAIQAAQLASQIANQQAQESYTKQLKELEQRTAAHLQSALEMQKSSLDEEHQAAVANIEKRHKAAQVAHETAEKVAAKAMETLRAAHEKELRGIQADVEDMRKAYTEKVSQGGVAAEEKLAQALAVQKAALEEEHETHVCSLEAAYAAARTQADLRATASSTAADEAAAEKSLLQERMREAAATHSSALAAARSSTEAQLQKQLAAHRVSTQSLERAHEERCNAQESRLQDIMTRHTQLEKQLRSEIRGLQQRLDEEESSLVSRHSQELEEKSAQESAHAAEIARFYEQVDSLQTVNVKLEARVSMLQAEMEAQLIQIERAQAATAEQRVLKQQLEARLTAVSATSRDERVKEMNAERAEHTRQLNLVQSDLEAAVAEAGTLRATVQDMKREQETLVSETSDTIATLRTEHEGLLGQLDADVKAVRADCAGEVQELRENFRKQQEALERQYTARSEALSATYATSQAKAESLAESRVSANAALMGKLVKTLEEDSKKMQEKLVLREERLAEVECLHREATEQLASTESSYNTRLATVKQQYADNLSRAEADAADLKERLRLTEQSHSSEMDSIRADYATTVRDLRDTFALQRATLEEQASAKASAAEERISEELARHKKDLQRVQAAAEEERSRVSHAVQAAEMRAADARTAAEALKIETAAAINTLRCDKDAAVALAPKLHAEARQLRDEIDEVTGQLEQHKRQLADAELARNEMHVTHREAVKAIRAEMSQETKQVEKLRSELELERLNHANVVKQQETTLHDMADTLRKKQAMYEANMTQLAEEHEAYLASVTRNHADEIQVNKEALLMLQNQVKDGEVAANVAREAALQEQEQALRRHLDKESVHIVDTHHAEMENLKEIHALEIQPLQEALRKAEWQVAVTMKCLTDMTDRRRLLQDHYSLDDMKQAIISRETEATRRAAEIAAGRTPYSEQKTFNSAEQHASPTISPIIANANNTSDVTTPVMRRKMPIEPSVTGYSPEILAQIEEADVEKLNKQASTGGGNVARDTEFSTLEVIQKSSNSDSATTGQATDELVAAILDGDVQGLRTIVRARGGDLKSAFWKDLVPSILPLHRAVAGLHFHGSETLLVSMLEALCSLGADINAVDGTSNTCLHKAIQVCTSKSVVAVVSALLQKGADVQKCNQEGHTALHVECSRVRTASVYVITSLLEAGADPMLRAGGVAPLTMILQRGAAAAAVEAGSAYLAQTGLDNGGWGGEMHNNEHTSNSSKNHSGSRRVWVRAAQALVVAAGGRNGWAPTWAGPKGESQLHLLCSAFPPALEDSQAYEYLLGAALDAGLSPGSKDTNGKTVLFVLCERFAVTPATKCPGSSSLIALMLRHLGSAAGAVVSEATRLGQSVFDLEHLSSTPGREGKMATGSSPGAEADFDADCYTSSNKDSSCLQNAKRLLTDATLNNRRSGSHANPSFQSDQPSLQQNQSSVRRNFASSGYSGNGISTSANTSSGSGSGTGFRSLPAKTIHSGFQSSVHGHSHSQGSEVDENAPPQTFKSGFGERRNNDRNNNYSNNTSVSNASSQRRRVGRQNEVVLDQYW